MPYMYKLLHFGFEIKYYLFQVVWTSHFFIKKKQNYSVQFNPPPKKNNHNMVHEVQKMAYLHTYNIVVKVKKVNGVNKQFD